MCTHIHVSIIILHPCHCWCLTTIRNAANCQSAEKVNNNIRSVNLVGCMLEQVRM